MTQSLNIYSENSHSEAVELHNRLDTSTIKHISMHLSSTTTPKCTSELKPEKNELYILFRDSSIQEKTLHVLPQREISVCIYACKNACGYSITCRKENRNGGVVGDEEGQKAGNGHS